jgi:glycosyltransferase involved in cell wall biosynthesis
MSIGTFTLIKNEIAWIKNHVDNIAPHVDEMVFYDGDSTDGTLQYLLMAKIRYPHIKVFEHMDPKDLRDDYVDLFDKCLRSLKTNWAVFLHPDMWIENPEQIRAAGSLTGQAMSMRMTSYAGNPGEQLYRMKAGRSAEWKNIFRLRNPDLGAHYFGHYGAWNEDVYFKAITGDAHVFHGPDFNLYPYEVIDSGIKCHHFSDVRPYERRLGRMKTCLINQGYSKEKADELAPLHPRVSLIPSAQFKMTPCDDPRRVTTHV